MNTLLKILLIGFFVVFVGELIYLLIGNKKLQNPLSSNKAKQQIKVVSIPTSQYVGVISKLTPDASGKTVLAINSPFAKADEIPKLLLTQSTKIYRLVNGKTEQITEKDLKVGDKVTLDIARIDAKKATSLEVEVRRMMSGITIEGTKVSYPGYPVENL